MDSQNDEQQMINGLANYINQNNPRRTDVDTLLQNHQMIINQVYEMRVDWMIVAEMAGVQRNRIYHWFNETFARHNSIDQLSAQDKDSILHEILKGIQTREIEQDCFSNNVRTRLFNNRDVNKAECSIAYNNILRTKFVQTEITTHGIQLPNKRGSTFSRRSSDIGLAAQGRKTYDYGKPKTFDGIINQVNSQQFSSFQTTKQQNQNENQQEIKEEEFLQISKSSLMKTNVNKDLFNDNESQQFINNFSNSQINFTCNQSSMVEKQENDNDNEPQYHNFFDE